ncbi:TlpA disulfide reductase family protein [Arachidicoccus terrestris]|uniref:TlpA disulfide reductase family protein n=1 Tax=Arachidicoccus terrestris TaxID=2875539 RepID=UPI001CC6AC0D|nr:TlpA disulfide reductase family protein [Arachidicoccus terrestris]UAY55207.1 AhpC/TSA family protein [Arachidicoccus terrestris]
MKKIIGIIVPSFCLLMACTNNRPHGYHLSGTVKGLDTGKVVVKIYHQRDRTSTPIDSTIMQNGKFELEGKIDTPQMVNVMITPGNWAFDIFLENKDLKVHADTTGSQYYDYTAYGYDKGANIKDVRESGSANYDDIQAYQNNTEQKSFDPVFDSLGKLIEGETKNIDLQYHYRDQMDSVRNLLQAVKLKQLGDYVTQKPDAVAGAYLFSHLYTFSSDMTVAQMESFMNKFTGEAKNSSYYQYLNEELQKKKAVAVGAIAPDFTLLKRDSTPFTLSSTRGKYIMIDFWASWCHPCREAIPHWKEIYQKYHDKGFEIVSVSDDSKWSDWKRAMDMEKMPWTQVCDEFPVKHMPAKVGSLYMTHYIPFYVLLDKEGKILVYSGKEADIDNKLKEIFGS